jgi:hypothetical protein
MRVYWHGRRETYPNDEPQAKLTLLLEGVAAFVITAMIIAGVMSVRACSVSI